MKKLVVMLLIASFAVVGSVAYANEGPVTTKSDSTMAKKMPRKSSKMSSKNMAMKSSKKSSTKMKSSKSKTMMSKNKKMPAKKDSTMSKPK
ncbi:MAG: hypothetical protein WAO19_13290 [Candidatus Kryptoniota bacterium]